MIRLEQLLEHIPLLKVEGRLDIRIDQLDFDSRKVVPHGLFVAIPGTQADGHDFIGKALDQGAAAVLVERWPEALQPGITYVQVAQTARTLGLLADRWYGSPSRECRLVGVTGTNGKTSTVTLLHGLFSRLGYKCGLLSTVENRIGEAVVPATHTTPDVLTANRLLREMADAGCDYVFMEVSSHAVVQERIAGLHFAGGIFTNITHDHLDYHGTFANYIAAKKGFFDQLPRTAFALVNADDRRGKVMVQNTAAGVHFFSLQQLAEFRARVVEDHLTGLQLEVNRKEVFTRLIGRFNAYNLLAAYGAAILLGQDETEVLTAISELRAPEGRFDYVQLQGEGPLAIVDYAHTPDALEKVLETIAELKPEGARVFTVVGCGGDRDREKRPKMARVADQWSDQLILTSDNPRTEDPDRILADMLAGLDAGQQARALVITNRKEAIKTACKLAAAADVILVAGKGHEKYQEINGVRHPFDDKEVLKEALL